MNSEEWKNRVTAKPEVCGGQPCIRDTRIPVAVVLDGLAEGLTSQQVVSHYPSLTVEDVSAAIGYAAEPGRLRVRRPAG